MRYFYAIIIAFFVSALGFGQTEIAKQSFEGSGWSFTPNPTTYLVGGDVWSSVSSPRSGLSATDGSNFWFMQDLNNGNGGGNFLHLLTFDPINVSSYESVSISFDYEVFEFDNGDDVFYEVFEDGVSQGEVQLINGNSNFSASGTETINISASVSTCYIILKAEQNGGGDFGFFDNVVLEGTLSSSNDTDTEVFETTPQVSGTTVIAANATSSATAFDVLGFEIEDQGTSDGLPTNVTTMRFVPGINNNADWTDHIQGITLIDGDLNIYTPTLIIADNELILDFGTAISVPDGMSLEFLLGVFLNTNNIVDGSIIQMQISDTASGFVADASGSDFIDPYTLGAVIGNNFTIDIDADELRYIQQPSDVQISSIMTPNVEIAYTDTNGNIDIDYDGAGFDISLTTSGSFDVSATTTATASNGGSSL